VHLPESSENYSLAQAKAAHRDDGGSTPYRDTTGENAVWNLLLAGVKLPGTYTINGPHGFTAQVSADLLDAIEFQRMPSRRRKDRMMAHLKKRLPTLRTPGAASPSELPSKERD
jgi:hypothetical protein